jgi:hypothetical protein
MQRWWLWYCLPACLPGPPLLAVLELGAAGRVQRSTPALTPLSLDLWSTLTACASRQRPSARYSTGLVQRCGASTGSSDL